MSLQRHPRGFLYSDEEDLKRLEKMNRKELQRRDREILFGIKPTVLTANGLSHAVWCHCSECEGKSPSGVVR